MNRNDFKEMFILAISVWFLADVFGLITLGPFDMITDVIGRFISPFT